MGANGPTEGADYEEYSTLDPKKPYPGIKKKVVEQYSLKSPALDQS